MCVCVCVCVCGCALVCVCVWFCSKGNLSTRCEDLCQDLGETQKSNLNAREGVLFRWCVWVLSPHPPVSSLFSSFSFLSLFVCCVLKRVFGFLGVWGWERRLWFDFGSIWFFVPILVSVFETVLGFALCPSLACPLKDASCLWIDFLVATRCSPFLSSLSWCMYVCMYISPYPCSAVASKFRVPNGPSISKTTHSSSYLSLFSFEVSSVSSAPRRRSAVE
jgi:hypothetical protein